MLAFRFYHCRKFLPTRVLNPTWTSQASGKRLKLNSSSKFIGSTAVDFSRGEKPAIKPTEMFPRIDEDYDKALYLLTHNPPEQRLDIPMPYSKYLQLEESWSKFNADNNISATRGICFWSIQGIADNAKHCKYPSLSYNALMQIATIITSQSALHSYTSRIFREIIRSNIDEYLSIHRPRAIYRIQSYGSTTEESFGPYGTNSKDPDGSFIYGRPGRAPRMQVTIECGVNENYSALCRDKNLWINQLGAKAVILICLKEVPRFKNPPTAYEDIKDAAAEADNVADHVADVMVHNLKRGNYGPLEYRGHIWAGKLDEVFVEVWRAGDEQPVRKWLISHGRANRLPKTIGLRISDFFPEDEWATSNIPDSNVHFYGGRNLWGSLAGAMEWTANSRFIRFLKSLDLPKD
ncbi:hypothetical protein POJ06DRAFT_203775 [Lipomyces tetrasporus]|uniref:Uncharacterized protein n=1 Tax=Lipomyces tetrasporus TaxID=54092 RepID=A0AAD7QMF6_9ASCO|nr:uncharacterized protein POJ06DRAFT_203775 [Lipomyces tetrasporus]KAJ8096587.1 hypothetical protein POJ06DRAFT_203775 [Lipomyces tetrasporus]